MRLLTLVFFLFVIFIDLSAQESTYRQYIKAGDLFYQEYKDYYNAGEFYKNAYGFKKKDSLWLSFRIAESAYHSWKLKEAQEQYLNVITYLADSCVADFRYSYLNLGLVYQRMSNYSEAIEAFESFIDYTRNCQPEDVSAIDYASQLINSCKWAKTKSDQPDIIIDSLGHINDLRKHELAPVPIGDSLIYTSMYFPEVRFNDFEHQVGNIFLTRNDSITNVFLNDLRINKRDSTIAFMTFNEDMSRMYYSVCYNNNTNERQCRIVTRDRISNDERTLLGKTGGPSTYTHPHWTLDKRTGDELLYFVSDRPGGEGRLDIWYTTLSSDGFSIGSPVNLKSINTSADEITPFFDRASQTMYFSSDRLVDSFSYGGKDIYKSIKNPSSHSFGKIDILEMPYNSSKHDIFYTRSGNKSWLSSNRRGPRNENPLDDGCCYDIFEAVDNRIPTSIPKPDTIYYIPEFSICPLDPLLTSSASELYSVIGNSIEDRIEPDGPEGFRVEKELNYKLVLKWKDIDTSFHIAFDTARGEFLPRVFNITKPVFHRPVIRDYCSYDTIDVFDPSLDIKLIQYDSSFKKAIDTTCINSDGLFRVQPGMNYWLVINKEGYQIDTFSLYCTKDCEISSCEYFIQPKKVKLTLMTKYICGSINTFLSQDEYSDLLTSATNPNNPIHPQKVLPSSRIYMVNPWETYMRTVIFPNRIDTTATIHIQTIRNQCDITHVIEYIDQPR